MIVILLPAYNEEKSLPTLLPKIEQVMNERGLAYRIIACNDGSRDRTGELLIEYAQSLLAVGLSSQGKQLNWRSN